MKTREEENLVSFWILSQNLFLPFLELVIEMKNNSRKIFYGFLILLPYIFGWSGADSVSVIAPMEENEQLALYSTVQDFIGKDWNGSELYPDPCGWTPIQVELRGVGFLRILM